MKRSHGIHTRDLRFCCGKPSCCCECSPADVQAGRNWPTMTIATQGIIACPTCGHHNRHGDYCSCTAREESEQ